MDDLYDIPDSFISPPDTFMRDQYHHIECSRFLDWAWDIMFDVLCLNSSILACNREVPLNGIVTYSNVIYCNQMYVYHQLQDSKIAISNPMAIAIFIVPPDVSISPITR